MVTDRDETEETPEKPAVTGDGLKTNDSAKPFPVVGIGASAGGLEALTELLRHLPSDTGMAFVLIQHLDPQHESALTEILSRATKLPVVEANQDIPVEPNRVYVIPPNADMKILAGRLHLSARTETRGQHMPIDGFLRSLARERRSQAIAVILSGSASDGALGLNAVKAEGGIAFAQNETAKYDGMPRSAIATGHVDFILPPKDIARELARIGQHPYLGGDRARKLVEPPSEAQGDLSKIFMLIHKATGVDFAQYKHGTPTRRISRRLALHKIQSLRDYVVYLRENPSEVESLFQDILIHVTGFFRDPDTFDALKAVIFPALMKDRSPDDDIRVWVPGCSTGEEVYSIAISLLEFLGDTASSRMPIKIFASDISDRSIDTARAGMYLEDISADVSPDRLRRFFRTVANGYEVSKTIREMCVFAKQDLTKDPPFSNLDLISCRNVIIYFGPTLQEKVLPIFHYSLKPSGFLMLGSSETVASQFSDLFTLTERRHKIYRKKPTTHRQVFDFPLGNDVGIEAGVRGEPQKRKTGEPDVQREVDRFVLAEYAPPGVVITQNLKILQVRGQTGPYLELAPGVMTADVLKMAREGLRLQLREAVEEVQRSRGTLRRKGLRVKTNDHYADIDLCVTPLRSQDRDEACFLVLFESVVKPPKQAMKRRAGSWLRSLFRRSSETAHGTEGTSESTQVGQLRRELEETKRYTRSLLEEQEATNEELRAANEETQSANEELLSTNEELETAKEELQATNEELGMVNEELKNRNVELARVNDDLRNLLSSIDIPIIMLGDDLRIRRFTPTAAKVLNLISSDVGRPIGDLKPKIDIPELETMIEEVVETLVAKEREVQDEEGRWYHMYVRPYRTGDEKTIDGAVITLSDIDQLKRTEREITAARDLARSIIERVREPLVILDADLRILSVNQSFYEVFQVSPEETENQLLYEIGNGQWNIPQLRDMLESVVLQQTQFADFEVERDFPKLGWKAMLLNARCVFRQGEREKAENILLAIEDISERKLYQDGIRKEQNELRRRVQEQTAELSAQAEELRQEVDHHRLDEDRLRRMSQVFMDSTDPILIMDLSGRVTDMNAEAERAYGGTRQELIGQSAKMLVPPERHQQVDKLIERCRQGEVVRNVEGLRLSKSGKVYPILFTLSLLTDEAGEAVGMANIAKDITELKRAEERLLQSERLAAIGEAMTGLTHESRNMLARSQAEVRMLRRRLRDRADLREFLEQLETAQGDLQQLFEEVRQYAAPVRLNPEPCHLGEILRNAWDHLASLREGRNVQLQEFSGDLDLRCEFDRFSIEQVFRNLLENALTACRDPVEIEIEYSEAQIDRRGAVRIAVRDNGPGLTAQEVERIFDPFYTTKTHGTGLGLAICRRIVNGHGGEIAVGPRNGRGAEFLLTLPRKQV